jgi:ATP-dependent protease ClpP protease subunit
MPDDHMAPNESALRDEGERALLFAPNVRLYGPIDDDCVRSFLDQLSEVRKGQDPLILELTTEGGDAEGGRRIALEVRLCRTWNKRRTIFVGKTAVMSAGVTIMAAFPRDQRFLADDCVLLVHERRLKKTLEVNGPMRANIQIVRELLAQMEVAERIEKEGFAELVQGSRISLDELYERATTNCYLSAKEALELGLIAGII